MLVTIILVLFLFGVIGSIMDIVRDSVTRSKPHFKQHLTGEIKFIEYRSRPKINK